MSIKIVSLNIWHGGRLWPEVIEFLKSQDADILALQEVYNAKDPVLPTQFRSMEVLPKELGYSHAAFAEAMILDDPHGQLPLGIAIFSKFPLRPRSIDYLQEHTRDNYRDVPEQWPIFPRILQGVEVTTPDGIINLFNMHGVWDVDGDNYSPARQKMSQVIIAAIKDKPNVILTGDTNAQYSNQAMRNIELYLNSVFGDALASTFNMRRKDNPGYAEAAVDLMYVSPNIQVVSKQCPDVDISDHLPLVVTLQID